MKKKRRLSTWNAVDILECRCGCITYEINKTFGQIGIRCSKCHEVIAGIGLDRKIVFFDKD